MAYPGWRVRDQLASHFRFALLQRLDLVPFFHQAQIFAYLDRKELAIWPTCGRDDVPQGDSPALRTWIEGNENWLISRPRFVEVEVDKYGKRCGDQVPEFGPDEVPEVDHLYFEVAPSDRPRPAVLGMSAGFKGGKSLPGGIIPASFGICPSLRWDTYGIEYDVCEPEFEYLLEALLSERGLNLPYKKTATERDPLCYTHLKNDASMGRMMLRLSNDARFVCRSMRIALESKSDPLKGKERDGFTLAEIYQFPSIQSVLSYRQNLSARRGYYTMFSTPDRPIMDEVNRRCDPDNEDFPAWQGVAEVHRRENPYAFVIEDWLEDMVTFSEEKFSVYWEGKSGRWIGAVYPPAKFFDTETHPWLWKDPNGPSVPDNFAPPPWMSRRGGVDAGTLYGVVSSLCDNDGYVYVLGGSCNYRYVADEIEQRMEETVESICSQARYLREKIGGKWGASYTDHNTQWKDEYRINGVPLRKGAKDPEHRTEVTRGMAQNGFIWFAPWLRGSELVHEWGIAKFPSQEGSTGRRRRKKVNDHLLDSLEHICAKHPRARKPLPSPPQDPIKAIMSAARKRPDIHLGDPQIGGA